MVARANHPGRILARELQTRKWTQKQFADLVRKTPAEVNDIISGKRNITTDWAIRIGIAFGTSHEVWLGMQNKFDALQMMKQDKKQEIFDHIRKKVATLTSNQDYSFH